MDSYMSYVDLMSSIHTSTKRDYLARVNDPDFPKGRAATLAKSWGYDYWDGSRKICYGGYSYIKDRWKPVAEAMIKHYDLKSGDKILDVGCGKGFLLYELACINPNFELYGIDISDYAIDNSKIEIRDSLIRGNATDLPYEDNFFDFVFSINTIHNLYCYELSLALREIERVGKSNKYICVESYRNEYEKANLLYWQVTCEAFNTPDEWNWWFQQTNYTGDHSLIFFE